MLHSGARAPVTLLRHLWTCQVSVLRGISLVHQPGLTANLDSFDLLDLVQVIHMDRHDLSLVVRDGSESLAVLRFSQGELLWAEFRNMRGEGAFIALAAQTAGSVEQYPWDGRGERNVSQPLSRLIMQAIAYRDAQRDEQGQQGVDDGQARQPAQVSDRAATSLVSGKRPPASEYHARPAHGQAPPTRMALSDDDVVPAWVREVQSASEAIHAQQTSALSPARTSEAVQPPVSPPTAPLPAPPALQEEVPVQPPQPTLPLSALNGKFMLPSLGNGNRALPQAASPDDPPTAPLPTVQGGLLDYAPRRESQPQRPALDDAPLTAGVEASLLPASQGEPKLSSLSILEQLASGALSSNGHAEKAAPHNGGVTSSPEPPASEAPPEQLANQGSRRQVDQALELFAAQVGPACIATAVVRTDGSVLAEYSARRNQEQELASSAYHLAHVMQSSLRALLMGGWGDLEDTIITGSTHSIVLRRLGRAEKGLFHIAVLERSGNPGLCRVRMRNSEPALLQTL
jgi:predicted regulator of Ras-like GTPase activity (Roadblock/LC7/MglB family)